MGAPRQQQLRIIQRLAASGAASGHLEPRSPQNEALPIGPSSGRYQAEHFVERRAALQALGIRLQAITRSDSSFDGVALDGNIENFIGVAQVPIGVIGPLRINGVEALGDFFVPLATTEGALVASYNRGASVASAAGGVTAVCLTESVSRAPCFVFNNVLEAGTFVASAIDRFDELAALVQSFSRHCELIDIRTTLLGKDLYLQFEYTTGDAAGQNMVTLVTQGLCEHLISQIPIKPQHWHIDGNLSGDKKASMVSFNYARGKRVVAEVALPLEIVKKHLHTTPEEMVRYWELSFVGGSLSGSIGAQGHFANALAALFIACGQDAACVAEAAVGVTRLDKTSDGGLYVSVCLPNLIVGTVGGGTHLPTQRECLEMIDCVGAGKARKFAEVCAAVVLCGEISMIAALTAGHFSSAHAKLGRSKKD